MAKKAKTNGPQPRTTPKRAPKFCIAGHRQAAHWKAGGYCSECHVQRLRREIDERLAREAEEDALLLGPPPAELVVRNHAGEVVAMARLPRGMRRGKGRRR